MATGVHAVRKSVRHLLDVLGGRCVASWVLDIPVLVIVGIVPIPRVLIAAALCASGGFAALHHECVARAQRVFGAGVLQISSP